MVKFSIIKLFRLKRFITFLVLFFTMLCQISFAQTTDWKRVKNDDDDDEISVFCRSTSESPINVCKGVVIVETTLSALWSVMDAYQNYCDWIYRCKEAENLGKVNDRQGYVYIVYDIRLFLTYRDLILRYEKTQQADGTVYIEMNAVQEGDPRYRPERDGIIRIYKCSGHWKFTPQSNKSIEIEYQLHMEPRGDLPPWLVNTYAPDVPFKTLQKLRAEVKKEKHASASIEWLR